MSKISALIGTSIVVFAANAWSVDILELYRESMASDPRILRAESDVAIFQARKRGSLGRLLPQSSLGFQGTRTAREGDDIFGDGARDYYNGERYFFSLSQPLYDKPGWEGFRSAANESEQYASLYNATVGEVSVDLVDRYTQVLAAEDELEFVHAERVAADEQLKLVEARYERKLASVTDLLAVEARRNILVSQELDAQNQVSIAREGISEMLGREVYEPFASLRADLAPELDLGQQDDWIKKALASNPGLKASLTAVKVARGRMKEASGRHHPTLGLTLSAQKSDIGFENSQRPVSESYTAAVNLNIPIYSGGQITAQIAETKARLRSAEQDYQQIERQLRRDIRQAFLNARSASKRVDATAKALESAEKSYEAQQQGYKYGTVTVVDVLNASETLFEARRDHRQAFYDLMVASLQLHQLSGEFSAEQIATLNEWLVELEKGG